MKSILDCTLFKIQNQNDLKERINSIDLVTDKVDLELIRDDLLTIQKRYNFATKNKVVSDMNTKSIVPVYNVDRRPLPSYIPNFLRMDPVTNRPICIFNLTPYAYMNKDKTRLTFRSTIQLYALMQSASVSLGIYNHWREINSNQLLLRLGSSMYSKIFTKVLDRMFAINLDPIKADRVKFIAGKFFLINQMDKVDSNVINNMAYSCCTGGTTLNSINQFNDNFNPDAFKDLESFITELSEKIEGFGGLNLRSYIDTFMKMYDVSALFALEYFPAFAHMINCVAVGSHLNKQVVIESLLDKDIDKFHVQLASILK